jgi:hypothetical protein
VQPANRPRQTRLQCARRRVMVMQIVLLVLG